MTTFEIVKEIQALPPFLRVDVLDGLRDVMCLSCGADRKAGERPCQCENDD